MKSTGLVKVTGLLRARNVDLGEVAGSVIKADRELRIGRCTDFTKVEAQFVSIGEVRGAGEIHAGKSMFLNHVDGFCGRLSVAAGGKIRIGFLPENAELEFERAVDEGAVECFVCPNPEKYDGRVRAQHKEVPGLSDEELRSRLDSFSREGIAAQQTPSAQVDEVIPETNGERERHGPKHARPRRRLWGR
jgi:hypothetical protein